MLFIVEWPRALFVAASSLWYHSFAVQPTGGYLTLSVLVCPRHTTPKEREREKEREIMAQRETERESMVSLVAWVAGGHFALEVLPRKCEYVVAATESTKAPTVVWRHWGLELSGVDTFCPLAECWFSLLHPKFPSDTTATLCPVLLYNLKKQLEHVLMPNREFMRECMRETEKQRETERCIWVSQAFCGL